MRAVSFVVSVLSASILALSVAGGGARAQDENPTTPGAIPNPGTYQGSMELQRRSDEQDQQFRQQQQQPQYQQPRYNPQTYGQRRYGQSQRYARQRVEHRAAYRSRGYHPQRRVCRVRHHHRVCQWR